MAAFPRPCPVARNISRVLKHAYHEIEDSIARTMDGITLASMIDDLEKNENTAG